MTKTRTVAAVAVTVHSVVIERAARQAGLVFAISRNKRCVNCPYGEHMSLTYAASARAPRCAKHVKLTIKPKAWTLPGPDEHPWWTASTRPRCHQLPRRITPQGPNQAPHDWKHKGSAA